jgi:hypothetical protein
LAKELDAVIWTDLAPRFEEIAGKSFSQEAALEYIESLDDENKHMVAEYILKAPQQTQTAMRPALELWARQVYTHSANRDEEA